MSNKPTVSTETNVVPLVTAPSGSEELSTESGGDPRRFIRGGALSRLLERGVRVLRRASPRRVFSVARQFVRSSMEHSRLERDTYRALSALPDWQLQDIGINRWQIADVCRELAERPVIEPISSLQQPAASENTDTLKAA